METALWHTDVLQACSSIRSCPTVAMHTSQEGEANDLPSHKEENAWTCSHVYFPTGWKITLSSRRQQQWRTSQECILLYHDSIVWTYKSTTCTYVYIVHVLKLHWKFLSKYFWTDIANKISDACTPNPLGCMLNPIKNRGWIGLNFPMSDWVFIWKPIWSLLYHLCSLHPIRQC